MIRALKRLRRDATRVRGALKRPKSLPLSVQPEREALTFVHSLAEVADDDMTLPSAVAEMHIPWHIPEEVMKARLDGRIGGHDLPLWHGGAGGAPMAGVRICRVKNALHMPGYGAVITPQGLVPHASVGEALYLTPSLAGLPGVSLVKGAPVMKIPRSAPVLERAAVFMAWGGRFNYGHFLLDCMAALTALDLVGLVDRFHPIAPPLNDWQREMTGLVLGPGRERLLEETEEPVVRVADLVFASPMDHFLHAPNRPLDEVRARILASIDTPPTGASRLYVSRIGDTKRPMVNEAELEAAMVARGFTVVAPETLPLRQQIALFRDADVVAAPTGAALANVLFCRPGTKVFEIQPTNFTSIWARGVSHFVGAFWHGFFAPSPMSETEIVIEGVSRPDTIFRWRIALPAVLDWIDRGLARDDGHAPLPPTPLP